MGRDEGLHARIDATQMGVVLRDRRVADQMWRALAGAWQERPALVIELLDQLAEARDGAAGQWDEAVAAIEGDLQLPEAETVLDEVGARWLANELTTAADLTLSARIKAPTYLPAQQDRSAA